MEPLIQQLKADLDYLINTQLAEQLAGNQIVINHKLDALGTSVNNSIIEIDAVYIDNEIARREQLTTLAKYD